MSESGLFLCKSCEQFFLAELGEREERICPQCDSSVLGASSGSESLLEEEGLTLATAPQVRSQEPVRLEKQKQVDIVELPQERERKTKKRIRGGGEQRGAGRKVAVTKRRRKVNYGKYFLLVLLWAAGLGTVTYHLRSGRFARMEEADSEVALEKKRLAKVAAGRRKYVNEQIPKCYETLLKFLRSVDGGERSLYVKESNRVGLTMTNHYRGLHERVVPVGRLAFLSGNLLDVEEGVAIESLLQDQEGRRVEAVFFRAPGEKWLLDWEHFVKSGSQSFLAFLAEPDDKEGQFRVLIRERRSPEIKARGVRSYSIYLPKILGKTNVEIDQAEFEVAADSPLAETLDTYAAKLEEENYVFESKLQKEEAKSLMRMNLRLKLEHSEDGEKTLKLLEILNPHWIGVESDGYAHKASDASS